MWIVTVTVRDSKGATSRFSENLPTATTLAAAETEARAFISNARLLITGKITGATLTREIDLSTGFDPATALLLLAPAAVGSDVEEGARFNFNSAGGFNTSVRLPTFNETFIVAGTGTVNTTDPSVEAFVDGVVGGIASDNRGADVVSLESAREDFQRSRKLRY